MVKWQKTKNMNARKLDFNGFEMAMLNQAFAKKIFTKPNIGDIWFVGHKQDSGSTFYFNLEYYNQLKNDMQFAYSQGKFAQSNANTDWINLMNRFLTALFESSELENNIDNNRIALTELEHIQVLQKFMTTQRSTEKKLEFAEQVNVKVKDEQNRPLEEDKYNKEGKLCKTMYYTYLDHVNIVEKRTIDMSGFIDYSFIHRYKNDKILEEWIFMGGRLSSIDEWIYDEGGRFVKKITYPAYG